MHFGAGFFGCKHPVDAGAFGISSFLPGGGFGDEPGVAVDASIETLAGQDADLDLDHVEPACVLGDVMEPQRRLLLLTATPHSGQAALGSAVRRCCRPLPK